MRLARTSAGVQRAAIFDRQPAGTQRGLACAVGGYRRSILLTTMSTWRRPHREQTSLSRHSRTVVRAPWWRASSGGIELDRRQSQHHTISRPRPRCRASSARRAPISLPSQKWFGRPACLRMPLAVCRLLIALGTGKLRFVIGLYQISWLPLPARTREQSALSKSSRSSR
jgi:hypothetical protein